MYKLFNKIKTPSLYEKSDNPFWDDDHISKGMLTAHLNPNLDAASRKLSFIDKSSAWIKDKLPPRIYPSLLDLGCGPGLYARKFCIYGYDATGVDISSRSITYAKEKAKQEELKINYYNKDYLSLDLNTKFDLITLIYCDYGALSTTDRIKLLKRIYSHLRPGGKFLLDVSSSYAFLNYEESQNWSICEDGGYWSPIPYLLFEKKQRYCENVTLHEAHVMTKEDIKNYYVWHTYFTLESIQTEVCIEGFSLVDYYSDVAGTPYHNHSDTIALIFEKQ